jgi:hypothetical protein
VDPRRWGRRGRNRLLKLSLGAWASWAK